MKGNWPMSKKLIRILTEVPIYASWEVKIAASYLVSIEW